MLSSSVIRGRVMVEHKLAVETPQSVRDVCVCVCVSYHARSGIPPDHQIELSSWVNSDFKLIFGPKWNPSSLALLKYSGGNTVYLVHCNSSRKLEPSVVHPLPLSIYCYKKPPTSSENEWIWWYTWCVYTEVDLPGEREVHSLSLTTSHKVKSSSF